MANGIGLERISLCRVAIKIQCLDTCYICALLADAFVRLERLVQRTTLKSKYCLYLCLYTLFFLSVAGLNLWLAVSEFELNSFVKAYLVLLAVQAIFCGFLAVLVFRTTERSDLHKFEEFLDRNRLELARIFAAREGSDS